MKLFTKKRRGVEIPVSEIKKGQTLWVSENGNGDPRKFRLGVRPGEYVTRAEYLELKAQGAERLDFLLSGAKSMRNPHGFVGKPLGR